MGQEFVNISLFQRIRSEAILSPGSQVPPRDEPWRTDSRPTSKIRQRVDGIRANRATPNGNGNASITIRKMAAMRRHL